MKIRASSTADNAETFPAPCSTLLPTTPSRATAANGWINAKRKPVNHADLWQQVCGRLGMHMAGFDSWQNPYRDKMREGLEIVLASRGQEDPWKDLRKK